METKTLHHLHGQVMNMTVEEQVIQIQLDEPLNKEHVTINVHSDTYALIESPKFEYKIDQVAGIMYNKDRKFYPGVIRKVNLTGPDKDTCDILWTDGAAASNKPKSKIRPCTPYHAGDLLEIRWFPKENDVNPGKNWSPGRIAQVNSDGSYDIRWDDSSIGKKFTRNIRYKLSSSVKRWKNGHWEWGTIEDHHQIEAEDGKWVY